MISHRKIGSAVGALLAASLVALAGCSSGGNTDDTPTGGEATDSQAPPADVPQELVVAPLVFPASLDQTQYPAEDGVRLVVSQVLDTLVLPADGQFEPGLAESWENPDPNTWVFHLREGVLFSDGTPFTASDVKATIERHVANQSVLAPLLAAVTEVDDSDPTTLTVTTDPPLGNLLGTLSLLFVGKGSEVNSDAYWLKPVGTGPFKVDSYTPDDSVVLSRNDSYWGEPAALESLTFRDVPEASARITALETGEIDVTIDIAPDQLDSVSGIEGVTLETVESYAYWMNWFNNSREPFTDVRVRQALWHALDYETIVPALYGDSATVGRAPVAASAFGAPSLEPYTYDPELAKSLLADAGYPDGFSTTINYPNDGGPLVDQLAQAMVSGWAAIGVTVTPIEQERAAWVEQLNALDWNIQIFTNVTATGDADYTLGRLYKSTAKRLGFASAEVDGWLDVAASSVDQDERAEMFENVSTYLWDNAVGTWPAQMKTNAAYKDDVRGLVLSPAYRIVFANVSRG